MAKRKLKSEDIVSTVVENDLNTDVQINNDIDLVVNDSSKELVTENKDVVELNNNEVKKCAKKSANTNSMHNSRLFEYTWNGTQFDF